MLTEDDVVESVCAFLTSNGYEIVTRATAMQRGHDVVALKDAVQVIVEAKGEGSSKSSTARFGQTFSKNQVFSHVAKAILKALRVVSAGDARAAVAFPDDPNHRAEVALVSQALRSAGIGVFWVTEGQSAVVDADWQV